MLNYCVNYTTYIQKSQLPEIGLILCVFIETVA